MHVSVFFWCVFFHIVFSIISERRLFLYSLCSKIRILFGSFFLMKFFFKTLGCKMNWLDSARLSAGLQLAGHTEAQNEVEADIIFINSCTVTARADRQSRQEASRAMRIKKKVAIFGCGPKADSEIWKKHFPNLLIFSDDTHFRSFFQIPEEANECLASTNRMRIPIAIQNGCDNQCTFCITRIARGKTEDIPSELLLRQISRAESLGVREIVLTGIQLASWGCGNSERFPEKTKLPVLLEEILRHTTHLRIRLSSLGPQFLRKEFFEVFSHPRICDHLHLSVQSGSSSVLKKMNRGHGREEVYFAVENARKKRPNVAITGDFITGFPTESGQDFLETETLVTNLAFAKLHVFPFSARTGTSASNFAGQIPVSIRKERAAMLRKTGDKLRKTFLAQQMGQLLEVLVEGGGQGTSGNYIRLKGENAPLGAILPIHLTPKNIAEDF